jgi:NADH:ubiquinone oxidoreductase subunit 4 (subunit M)
MLRNGGKLPDLNFAEWFTLYPMAGLALLTGVVPALVLDFLGKPAEAINEVVARANQTIDFGAIIQQIFK